MLTKIENYAIHRWGFEHKATIALFRLTEFFRSEIFWALFTIATALAFTTICFAILATK